MKNTTTTTTKIKIVYLLFFAIGLTLLCAFVWSDPITQDALSLMAALPALLKSIPIKIWGSLAVILILIFAQGFYNIFEKEQRHDRVRELPIITAQEEPTSQLIEEANQAQDEIYIPIHPKVLEKWEDTYPIIKPMRTQNRAWTQIKDAMYTDHPGLPFDEETLKKILAAGDAGKLKI